MTSYIKNYWWLLLLLVLACDSSQATRLDNSRCASSNVDAPKLYVEEATGVPGQQIAITGESIQGNAKEYEVWLASNFFYNRGHVNMKVTDVVSVDAAIDIGLPEDILEGHYVLRVSSCDKIIGRAPFEVVGPVKCRIDDDCRLVYQCMYCVARAFRRDIPYPSLPVPNCAAVNECDMYDAFPICKNEECTVAYPADIQKADR